MREAPPVKPEGSVQGFDDFFTVIFESEGGKILGLYQKRDHYLFASKIIREAGPPQPFEMLDGVDFTLPYNDIRMIGLHVSYQSLQGASIPSYKREDLNDAVKVLALGFDDNEHWGLALATLVGATSDAIKSFGMEHHVCRGLNIQSNVNHAPSERLLRINKNWSNISKSIRSGKFDYVLTYKNENGVAINEKITRFSAGLILAVINFKDGSKRERNARKLEKQDRDKRKRDENEEKEGEGSKKSTGTSGKKTNKRRRGNFPGTRHNDDAVIEAESETLKSPKSFSLRMTPRYVRYSSSSDSSYFSDSDSDSEVPASAILEMDINVKRLHSSEGAQLLPQSALVTVIGHVGDGKTSLLDTLHSTYAAPKEAEGTSVENIEFLQQSVKEFVKEEKEQTEEIPEPMVQTTFPVGMFPCKRHMSDDSSDSDTETIVSVNEPVKEIGISFKKLHCSEGAELLPCPSAVTVMGHVGYGETSLLDAPSSISVAANEAGEHNKRPATMAKNIEFLQHDGKECAKEEQEVQADKFLKPMVDYDSETIAQGESEMHEYFSKGRATVPTSFILVKHGTKHPVEVGDKDPKVAKKMASPKSTDDETEQY